MHGAIVRYAFFPAWGDMLAQMPGLMDRMMKEDFDGYVLPGFFVLTIEDKIREVLKMGKKVFLVNNDTTDKSLRNAIFQQDAADAASMASKILANAIGKKGNVMIVEASREMVASCIRSDAFQEAMDQYRRINLDLLHGEIDKEMAYQQVLEYLKEHPNTNGIYVTTAMGAACARAVEDSGIKAKLVVYDQTQDIFQYIKKGYIVATIGQDPFSQGHDPVVWMYNCIVTGEALPSEYMKCRSSIVDKTNVDNLIEV